MNIFGKDTGFFDLFDQMGTHVVSSARYLHTLASGFPQNMSSAHG